jgi:hypothetical protein
MWQAAFIITFLPGGIIMTILAIVAIAALLAWTYLQEANA